MIILIIELLFIAIPCIYFSLIFPPSSVAICLLFSQYESTGIGVYLQQYAPHAYMIMTACLFIAYLRTVKCINRNNTIYSKAKIRFFSRLIFTISFLMLISIIINGYSALSLVYFVPLSTLIAAVYWQKKPAIRLFLVVLTIHLTIATILTSPFISLFHWISVLSVHQNQMTSLSTIGSRQSAQLAHVIQLAYYSGIGLITGVWLVSKARTRKVRIFGFYLALVSLWLNMVTATRAIWFALLFAAVFSVYRKSGLKHMLLKLAIGLIIAILAISSIEGFQETTSNTSYNIIAARFASMESTEFSESSYRILALNRSFEVIISKPIFGYGNFHSALEMIDYMPHQMFIYYALLYGVLAGICILFLLFISIRFDLSLYPRLPRKTSIISTHPPTISPNSRYLTAIAWLSILIAFTNGSGGRMFQWVIIGVCCARWIHQPEISA